MLNKDKIRREKVAVVCRSRQGEPDVFVTTVNIDNDDYECGIHYDIATDRARDNGYEGPFICFDNSERENLKMALDDDNKDPNDDDFLSPGN